MRDGGPLDTIMIFILTTSPSPHHYPLSSSFLDLQTYHPSACRQPAAAAAAAVTVVADESMLTTNSSARVLDIIQGPSESHH